MNQNCLDLDLLLFSTALICQAYTIQSGQSSLLVVYFVRPIYYGWKCVPPLTVHMHIHGAELFYICFAVYTLHTLFPAFFKTFPGHFLRLVSVGGILIDS